VRLLWETGTATLGAREEFPQGAWEGSYRPAARPSPGIVRGRNQGCLRTQMQRVRPNLTVAEPCY
jgi:hypothetical protein